MPRQVRGPDGVIRTFPDDATDAEIAEALEASQSERALVDINTADLAGMRDKIAGALPNVGGLVGSFVGRKKGGNVGASVGAGVGGAVGKGAELLMDSRQQSIPEGLRAMGGEALKQAGLEGMGIGAGKGLKAGSSRLMQSVLKPSQTLRREFPDVAANAVKFGIPIGEAGEKKVGRLVASHAQQTKDRLALMQRAGAPPIDIRDVVPSLQAVAQKVAKEPLDAGAKLREVSDIGGRLIQQHPNPIPLLEAQEMKQAAQRVATQGFRQLDAGSPINRVPLDANVAIARGLREQIERRADVGPLNATTEELIGVRRALENAMGRISNTQPLGMNLGIATMFGAGSGLASQDTGVGGGAAATYLALTNPWLASRLAIAGGRLAPLASHAPNVGRAAALISALSRPAEDQGR